MDKPDVILPTPEFLAKHSVEEVETRQAGKKRIRVTDQLWIDYYLKHNHINHHQYNAAQRLLALYRAAGRAQRMTGKMEWTPPSSNTSMSDYSADSFADFQKVVRRMGRESFRCVEDVVLHDMSAAEWARKNGRNPKAAPEILRICLDDLEYAFKHLNCR